MALVLLDYNNQLNRNTTRLGPMEFLLAILVILIGLAAFDTLAVELGVDSRNGSDDPHAPLFGAH